MVNKAKNAMDEIAKVLIGKEEIIKRVMTAILAGGHIMVQDMPGVGKTTMSLAVARVLGMNYQRILFTPDIMPKDLANYSVHFQRFEQKQEERETAHVFMADEINASSPKIRSLLVKMMEEKKLKVAGTVTVLPSPYVVIATQNPLHPSGEFLPISQMDHFMLGISIGYPDMISEIQMLKQENIREKIQSLNQAMSIEDVLEVQTQVNHVYVSEQIYEYIVRIVNATRTNQLLEVGVSPRGSIDLLKMAKANAFLEGRDYVIPADVQRIFVDTTSHRVSLSRYAKLENRKSSQILFSILETVDVPSGMERKK